MKRGLEIERKYLLSGLPVKGRLYEGSKLKAVAMDQGYILRKGRSLRVRKADDEYMLTEKKGRGLVREEIEVPIFKEAFELLWPFTEGARVQKVRIHYEGGWEIDQYAGPLYGLYTAELELESENQEVEIPDFIKEVLVREVTGEKPFTNKNLSLKGLPEDSVCH